MSGYLSLYSGTEKFPVGPEVDRASARMTNLERKLKDIEDAEDATPSVSVVRANKIRSLEQEIEESHEKLVQAKHNSTYWVELKCFLSNDDYSVAQRALVLPKVRGHGKTQTVEGTVEQEVYQQIVVFRSIVDWNLTDENGNKLPIDMVSVAKLPQSAFIRLYARVTELNNQGDLGVPADAPEVETRKAEAQFPDRSGVGNFLEEDNAR